MAKPQKSIDLRAKRLLMKGGIDRITKLQAILHNMCYNYKAESPTEGSPTGWIIAPIM